MQSASTPRETARLTVHRALDDLEMLAARYRDHAYALHTHPTWVFGVVTAGVERFRVGRTVNLAAPGAILVVNPEEPHDGERGCDEGWSYRTCYPSPALMREIADELELCRLPMFHCAVLPAPDLAAAFVAAHELGAAGDAFAAEAGMLTVLRAVARRFGDGSGRRDGGPTGSAGRVEAYDAAIAAGIAAPVSLAALAAAGGVTRFQVIRDFKRAAGMTPTQYVRDRRVRHACRLIAAGMPLAHVAVESGFSDQSHLTRAFKCVKGVTPAVWRAAVAG